jgi:predicted metal-dependent hydrolase
MTDVLNWDNRPVKLSIGRRKSIALHVKDGEIELRAPKNVDLNFAQTFINSKDQWLRSTLAKQAALLKDKIDYSRANTLPFMGLNVPILRKLSYDKPQWILDEKGLLLTATEFESPESSLNLYESFYKTQAKFWLTKKTNGIAANAGLTSRLKDITFRKTKTKWGHCTATGRIQYNWQIMMAPECVIDYLVSHEVSHLKHLDHSTQFWAHVGKLHSTYKKDRIWLRQNEHRLTLV